MTQGFCGETSQESSLRCLCFGLPARAGFGPGGVGPSVLTFLPVTKNVSGVCACAAVAANSRPQATSTRTGPTAITFRPTTSPVRPWTYGPELAALTRGEGNDSTTQAQLQDRNFVFV